MDRVGYRRDLADERRYRMRRSSPPGWVLLFDILAVLFAFGRGLCGGRAGGRRRYL